MLVGQRAVEQALFQFETRFYFAHAGTCMLKDLETLISAHSSMLVATVDPQQEFVPRAVAQQPSGTASEFTMASITL